MNPFTLKLRYILHSFIVVASLMSLSACSMINDDLQPCPTGLDIRFVYDYNIDRANMFHDLVGGVTLYIFDEEGKYLTSREENNSDSASPLSDPGYRMHLNLPAGKYQFVALAHPHSYDTHLKGKSARYRRSSLSENIHNIEDLKILLDRQHNAVPHNGERLDILWHAFSSHPVEIIDQQVGTYTMSLVRDTKELTISLHELDEATDLDINNYSISLEADNGSLAHDNSLLDDDILSYTPYATWNTEYSAPRLSASRADGIDILTHTAHAAISFNRILHHNHTPGKTAILSITNKQTGNVVARINLPDCLAQGRGAFEFYNYSEQEFLDREYDYKLDFFLRGDKWMYMNLSISIASWSKRIQNEEL